MLGMALCRCRVMLATVLLSHVGDGATEAIWPWHDVDAESCWRQCYRVMATLLRCLAVAQCRCQVMLATMLPSHASDDAIETTWPRRDVDAKSCGQRCY
jgi:hypothetical protein